MEENKETRQRDKSQKYKSAKEKNIKITSLNIKKPKDKKQKELKWHKLDNTAKIYPVITSNTLSGVYRMSTTLTEEINPEFLQQALERILPWFENLNVRLRRGVFWYYYETNKKMPKVEEEFTYPCRYIDPYSNNQYLFRTSYYKNRINIEVFHGLTDGYGGVVFLKELTCQYIRIAHPKRFEGTPEGPTKDTSFNMENSYLKHYKKTNAKGYGSSKAFSLGGEMLAPMQSGIIHGYIDIPTLKVVCKKYQVTITQYFAGVLTYCIYKEFLNEQKSKYPIRINIPVDLRNHFGSTTIRNFFAVIFAHFEAEKEHYTFEEVLHIIKENLEEQLKKETLERLISFNVSNEKKFYVRILPLFIKNLGIKYIYRNSSKNFTTTLSNLGRIKVEEEYEPWIEQFHIIMGVSKKQRVKSVLCSYKDKIIYTFSSVLEDTSLQRAFFKTLSAHGVQVAIESNGVYHEEV